MPVLNLNSGIPKKYVDDADAANKSLVDAEVQNRASADQTLQSNINTLATRLDQKDAALQGEIDAVEQTIAGYGNVVSRSTGTSSGNVPVIGSDGKLPAGIMPEVALSKFVGTVANKANLSTLTAQNGDWGQVTSDTAANNGAYIYNDGTWVKMGNPDITFAGLSGAPSDNTALKAALDAKFDKANYYGPTSKGSNDQLWLGGGGGWTTVSTLYDDGGSIASVLNVKDTVRELCSAKVVQVMGSSTEETISLGSSGALDAPSGYSYVFGRLNTQNPIVSYLADEPYMIIVTPASGYEAQWAAAEAKAFEGTLAGNKAVFVATTADITGLKVNVLAIPIESAAVDTFDRHFPLLY